MGKRIFAVIAVMVIAALTLGTMIGSGIGPVSLVETPAFSGDLLVTVETKSGTVVYEVPNTVVDIGKTHVKDYLEEGTIGATDPTKWIALSDDTLTAEAGWEVLPGEISENGLTREAGTVTPIDGVSFSVSHKFTCTGDGTAVKCSGLHWAVSGSGNLWAAASFTPTTLNDGDNITITWTVTHE